MPDDWEDEDPADVTSDSGSEGSILHLKRLLYSTALNGSFQW